MLMRWLPSRSFLLSKAPGLLYGFLIVAGGFGWTQEIEPNDSPDTATLVVVGATTSGSNDPAGDTDFFKFVSVANRYYRIETFSLSPGSDTVMVLYDSDKVTVLAEDDQSGEEENASKILWASLRVDTFYIEIFQFFSSATGSYSFVIEDLGEVPEDDHGNSPDSSATELTVDNAPTAGANEIPGDVDFFSFTTQGGLFYDMETFDLGSGSDTLLALFSPDGQRTLFEDDQSGREFNASRIIWMASETNVFYLRESQFMSTETGTYTVGVRNEGPSKPIVADGTPVGGLLEEAGDIDIFALAAEEGHRYHADLVTGNVLNRFALTVLDTDGLTELAENKFSESTLTWQAPATGTYYLVVREDIEGGDYDLSVLDLGLPPPDADLNDDFVVDYQDLHLFHSQWQSVYPTPTPGL